jgi:regulator of microtubule dynamics protein 3
MRILFKAIPILFIMLGFLVRPLDVLGDSGHDVLLRKAYELKAQYKETEALAVYEQIIAADEANYEALCHASLLHSQMGNRFSDDTRKLNHFSTAKDYAQRAYLMDSADARANFAMALSLASLATVSGPKQRLATFAEIKPYLDATLQADFSHADAWHLMGRWYFKMANLNFAEVAAYKVMLGSVSDKAITNQNAIYAMEMAILHNPNNLRYYFDLANIYQEMKNKEACVYTLQRAMAQNLDLQTKEELELSRRCKILLQEYSK